MKLVLENLEEIENGNDSACAEVKLDKDVTSVGAYAFQGNTVITSIDLNKATSIGAFAFDGCANLLDVKATTALLSKCGMNAFRDTAFFASEDNWTDGTLRLQTQTFSNTKRYVVIAANENAPAEIVFDKTICTIADGAFQGNTAIVSVKVTDQLYNIGAYAFEGCTALESFSYTTPDPKDLYTKDIGEGAFMNCPSLKSFTVSQKVTSLSEHTFENCTSMTYVVIGVGTFGAPDSAFRNTGIVEVYYRVEASGIAQIDAINGASSKLSSIPVEKRYLFYTSGASSPYYKFWSFVGDQPVVMNK